MAKFLGFPLMLVLIALIIGFTISTMANPIFDDQQEDANSVEVENWVMEKRPFCNAFAGCGRKRASSAGKEFKNERVVNNLPRMLNIDSKLWDKLYSKLQQRYHEASKN